MRLGRTLRVFPLAVLFTIAASPALAATPKEKGEAHNLATDAKKAAKEKRWADAEAALRKSDDLDPSPQTKIDLADVLANEGKLVESSRILHGAADATANSPATKKLNDAAKKALADVEAKIPWIQIDVDGPSTGKATTTIDGTETDASSEIPIDPGDHQVTATAEGFDSAEKKVHLAEGAHEKVKLSLMRKDAAPTATKSSGGGSKTPAIAAFVVGGVGLVVGAGAGIAALTQASSAKSLCNGNSCPPSAADSISASKTSGTISTIGFIAGGVGVATGIILLIVSPGGEKKTTQTGLTPWVGLGQAGLSGRF
jgi:hypothetical protein